MTARSWPSPLLALVTLATLAGAPAQAAGKIRVVVLNVSTTDARLKALAESVSEQILTELGHVRSLDLVGTSDMATMVGLERQKAMMGCGEQSSECMAEISSALGAPWVLTGTLGRAGKATRIDLKLIRARDGRATYRDGRNFNEESETFDLVTAMLKGLVAELGATSDATAAPAMPGATTPAPVDSAPTISQPGPPLRWQPWATVGAGGVALVVGGVVAGLAVQDALALQVPGSMASRDGLAAERLGNSANARVAAGSVVAGLGVAALAGGLAWALLGQPGGSGAAVVVAPSGVTVAWGGAW